MSSGAINFSPYQPPPDEQAGRTKAEPFQQPAPTAYRDDEEEEYNDPRYATESYQAGSHQQQQNYSSTQNQSYRNDTAASPYQQHQQQSQGSWSNTQPDHASWVTSQGISISNLCFIAWALPPFSGVAVLILETTNDLARFHAYQASLCGVAGIVSLYILRSWFGWYTFSIIVAMAGLGASWVAGSNASNAAPTLDKVPFLPFAGPLAEEWVGTE